MRYLLLWDACINKGKRSGTYMDDLPATVRASFFKSCMSSCHFARAWQSSRPQQQLLCDGGGRGAGVGDCFIVFVFNMMDMIWDLIK